MRDFSPEQPEIPAFFSNIKFYKIPKYQRPYTWDEDRIQDLWDDISSSEDGHYLGVVVLKMDRQDGRYEVIDGQQRLITLTLFIALLRNLYNISGDIDTAKDLQKLITREGYSIKGPVLLAGTHLRLFFEKYIQSYEVSNHQYILEDNFTIELNNESSQLVRNYKKLYREIVNDSRWVKDPARFLTSIKNTLDATQILSLTVENEDDAFTLFETLNYKLTRLSEIDLIKNRIFMSLAKKKTESDIEKQWDELVLNIGGEKRELSYLDTYLKYFWWSRYDKLPPKKIFKELRSDDIPKIFNNLLDDSKYYKLLIHPVNENLILNSRDLTEIRKISKWLNLRQVNIVLLSLIRLLSRPDFREYSTPKINKLLKMLPQFVIAYKYTKRSPSRVERIYSRNAIKIFKAESRTELDQSLAEFIDELKNEFPLPEEFYENFDLQYRPNDSANNNLIAYLMEKIMFDEDELRLKETDIEHVFPQRPSGGFEPSEQNISQKVHDLGNLSPLGSRINQEDCINLRPIEKLEFYKKSKIPMILEVKKIIEKQGWSAEIVDVRTTEIKNSVWDFLSRNFN